MPIIDVVGRKNFRSVFIYVILYLFLIVGGVTMVYPFLLMLAGSTTNDIDYQEYRVVPKYYYDDEALFKKYVSDKYTNPGPNLDFYNQRASEYYLKFQDVKIPKTTGIDASAAKADWNEFMTGLPMIYKTTGFRLVGQLTGKVERMYRKHILNKYGDLKTINTAYGTEYDNVTQVRAPNERLYERGFRYENTNIINEFLDFKNGLPTDCLYPILMEGNLQVVLKRKYDKIEDLNKKYNTNYKNFNEILLSETISGSNIKEDWESFVKTRVPLIYLSLDERSDQIYRKFLEKKYKKIEKLNIIYFSNPKEGYKSFKQLKISNNYENEANNKIFMDILEMIKDKEAAFPAAYIKVKTSEKKFRDFAEKKYKNIDAYNKVYASTFKSFSEVRIPNEINDWFVMKDDSKAIRKNFITRNYTEVIEYIVLHGKAIGNTAFFCFIVILTTLTVNPMCAYALSRFSLSYSNKVLIFLLATMAFPAEVAMIPNFLMLKKLHMLNTYWALILPGLASGYSIFILKGFFDSLPKEFYEAAQMDGAGEMKIFWDITLPLAKPILAYLSLGAFVGAYTAFMFALLVCQDPNMWTLMVWLYEMQSWASSPVLMSALVLSAIPTLFIFLFAQRVIMRGVIIPVQH